jgi:hypothetical protein
VNFDRVPASLTEQIASVYMRRSGIQPGPLAQQAVVVGISVADPVIRKLVSPEALSELLAVGWPVAVVRDPPPGTLGLCLYSASMKDSHTRPLESATMWRRCNRRHVRAVLSVSSSASMDLRIARANPV